MATKKQVDPADEGYKAPDPAPSDPEAEAQELQRAEVQAHGPEGAPDPPPPPKRYPKDEAAPGFHEGPPARINCPKCGHAHQAKANYETCARCGAKLPDAPDDEE